MDHQIIVSEEQRERRARVEKMIDEDFDQYDEVFTVTRLSTLIVSSVEYLLKSDIVLINQKTIQRHGGNFVPPVNFLHEENLDYLVDAVQAEMFGRPLYPELHEKSGSLLVQYY